MRIRAVGYRRRKYLNMTAALKLAEEEFELRIVRSTLIEWAKKHGFGFQWSGPNCNWVIDETEFRRFLNGKIDRTKKIGLGENC